MVLYWGTCLGIRIQLLFPLLALLAGMGVMVAQLIDANLAAQNREVANRMENLALAVGRVSIPKSILILQLMKGMSGADLVLCDGQGTTLKAEDGKLLGTLEDTPQAFSPDEIRIIQAQGIHAVGQISFHARRVPWGASPETAPFLFILIPREPWGTLIWRAVKPVLIPALSGGILAFLLAIALANRLTSRFKQISRQTQSIASGNFSPMDLPRGHDELRELCESINQMAAQLNEFRSQIRLDERLKLLGQVSAGLAHQLRNSTAGARLALQLHAKTCPQSNQQDLQVALRQLLLTETQVKRFLDLGAARPLKKERLDLGSLAREWVELLGPQCRHSRIETIGLPDDEVKVLVQGDRDQLGDLIHNLLINAMEAAGPGGKIQIQMGKDATLGWIDIFDSGSGPSAEIGSRIFDPFVTSKKEGVGLGLAMARQVARAHGGDVTWTREKEMTCFRLTLPLSESPPAKAP